MFAITGNYIKIRHSNSSNNKIRIIKHFNEIELNFCNDNPFKVVDGEVVRGTVGAETAREGRWVCWVTRAEKGNNCANILGQHFLILVTACGALAKIGRRGSGRKRQRVGE